MEEALARFPNATAVLLGFSQLSLEALMDGWDSLQGF
jgi:hypothetical protein